MRQFNSRSEGFSGRGDKGSAVITESGDIVAFARDKLGFNPDEKQEMVLRGGRRGIVNCTRQWGKSTVTAAKAVHRAYTVGGSLTLVVTPSGTAERGVSAESGGIRAAVGDQSSRGWGQ